MEEMRVVGGRRKEGRCVARGQSKVLKAAVRDVARVAARVLRRRRRKRDVCSVYPGAVRWRCGA